MKAELYYIISLTTYKLKTKQKHAALSEIITLKHENDMFNHKIINSHDDVSYQRWKCRVKYLLMFITCKIPYDYLTFLSK